MTQHDCYTNKLPEVIQHDCYITALSVGLPLVLVALLGQISIYVLCRLIEEHLWPRIKTSHDPLVKHYRVDSIDEEPKAGELERRKSQSSSSSEANSSTPSPIATPAAPSPIATPTAPSPIATPTAQDLPSAPFTPATTSVITSGSAQQSLAERNLQFSVLHNNVMALLPLVKQKAAATSEISESNKRAFLNLIDSFTDASSSLSSLTVPVIPTSSTSILDSPRDVSDLSDEQRREEESQYLMKTLADLTKQ